jgi:dolichol-phosphate mannosyltransferase
VHDALLRPIPLREKTRIALRRPGNWLQLARFAVVGGSGYAVNLGVFSFAVHELGIGYRTAAVLAFLLAVSNNFAWNRAWTFSAQRGRKRAQAPKFLVVSVATFGVTLLVLMALVEGVGLAEVPAQAVSVALGLPLNFVGQKLWSFRP